MTTTDPAARPGERLLEVVAAMDRLRSPGGCPWDAEQTHASLAPYAIEEAHELAEAIDCGDRAHVVEELGDLLLQVIFHARVGQDDPAAPFDVDDVAAGLLAKLHRRHPHVFAGGPVLDAAGVAEQWEQIKAVEKPERDGILDGVPLTLPALQRATKLLSRLERSHQGPDLSGADDDVRALWDAVARLHVRGLDAEQALGSLVRDVAARVDDRG